MITRRNFMKTSTAGLFLPALIGRASAAEPGAALPIPDVMDLRGGSLEALDAITGKTGILQGLETPTIGYSQSYLGPVIRANRGETARLTLGNRLDENISVHWHGLHIEGAQDGGPHSMVAPDDTMDAILDIDQPEATLWYHSHIHMRTGPHVWYGLAGMMIIDDPDAANNGLPDTYGIDDIPLVIQDRNFESNGNMPYAPRGPNLMMGYRGNEILVNGAIRPEASVPAGLVRFRILNGSNARIYHFRFDDGRNFQQIASDGGLLQAPVTMNKLTLAPAERVEIVVDFSDGKAAQLLSLQDDNLEMAMMARMIPAPTAITDDGEFEVMRFSVDMAKPAIVTPLPAIFAGAPNPDFGEPVRRRVFSLDMMASGGGGMMGGGGMGGGGMMSGGGHATAINGVSMDMAVINEEIKLGDTEIWEIQAAGMAHPFHVHGTSFKVLTNNGQPVDYATTGMKDVALVNGITELLVRFDRKADADIPYMYHCHILEHEDLGMMGQFTVT